MSENKQPEPVNQQMLAALKAAHRMLTRDYIDPDKMKVVDLADDAIAAAESAQAQQPADGVVLDALTIKLRLVEDELPVLEKFGSSYGGEWSSGWVVLFSPDGSCDVHRLTVSGEKDKKEEAEARKRSSGKWLTGFIWQYDYTAWCYLDEVTSALAAHKAQEGGAV